MQRKGNNMGDQRVSYLDISSTDDVQYNSVQHNPANFTININNPNKTNNVTRLSYNTISIPRMFNTIYAGNNTLVWYKRQVLEILQPNQPPNTYLRTVATNWTETRRLVLPDGQLNINDVLTAINTLTGASEVWSYDSTNRTVVIVATPPGPTITFGLFVDPGHVTPPVSYANMTFLSAGGTDMFETLGLQRASDLFLSQEDNVSFDQFDPNSFDTTKGSNLEGMVVFPLFDRTLHNYQKWATLVYTTPRMLAPNFAGPTIIKVQIRDCSDSQTISAGSGKSYDVITTLNIADVPFGAEVTRQIRDVQGEGIGFIAPRDIRAISVQLLDRKFRQLTLPRNNPVHIVLQLVFKDR